MSLIFENAIGEFEVDGATLYEPADSGALETDSDDRVPLQTITVYAAHHEQLHHPDRDDWVCIPLHEPDSARLTGEYVAFTDHSVRGEILVYQDGDSHETIPVEEATQKSIARRLRFWHSDYTPEDYPSYYTSPIRASEPARNPVDEQSPKEFLNELRDFIDEERSARRETRREQAYRQTPESIHRNGGAAIPDLASLGNASGSVYRFRLNHDRNGGKNSGRSRSQSVSIPQQYGVYEQNEVLLSSPENVSAPEAFPLTATITDVTGANVYAEISWSGVDKRASVQRFLDRNLTGYGLVSLLNPIPLDRESEAIDTIQSNQRFRRLIAGRTDLTFGNRAAALSEVHDDRLNQEQQVAVEHALLADDLFCIHGPPGTGKTRALVEIVRRSVEADQSVLVCADSNQAVDNLVVGSSRPDDPDERSLHAYSQCNTDEFTLARANSHRSRNDLVHENYGSRNSGKADVVATTNSSAASLNRTFDVAVVDEATQSTCTATCIPLSKADKIVLAGDHKQLPPFSSSETPPDSAFGMSLFEHLYANGGIYEGVGVRLRTQYRMHDDICYFPNRRFYDRGLRNGRAIESLANHPPVLGYDIGGTETEVETSFSNSTEARLTAHLATDLVSDEPTLSPSDVGIITPYRAQVSEIQEQIDEHTDLGGGPMVDTVDAFQGNEKAAILLSLVRSNPDGEIGFMGRPTDGPRRLNVALTRSQRFCAVIGNWNTLTATIQGNKSTELYRDLHSHLRDTGRLQHVEPELIPI